MVFRRFAHSIAAMILATLLSPQFSGADDFAVERYAKQSLSDLGLEINTPFYSAAAKMLMAEPEFRDFANTGNIDSCRAYARYILLSEVENGLRTPDYPPDSLRALYPFVRMQHQAATAPAPEAEAVTQYLQVILPKFANDPLFLTDLYVNRLMSAEEEIKFWNIVQRLSLPRQIEIFRDAAVAHAKDERFSQLVGQWVRPWIQNLRNDPAPFFLLLRSLHSDLADSLAPVLWVVVQDWLADVNGTYFDLRKLRRLKNLLLDVRSIAPSLAGRERLSLEILFEERGSNTDSVKRIRAALYPTPNTPAPVQSDKFQALVPLRTLMFTSRETMSELERAILLTARERIASTQNGVFRPLGSQLFSALLRDQPELAREYAPTFFTRELFPRLLGDEGESFPLAWSRTQEEALISALSWLKKSNLEELKSKFQQALAGTSANRREMPQHAVWFHALSFANDVETPEGRYFFFQNAPADRLLDSAEHRAVVLGYIEDLLREPENFNVELAQRGKLFQLILETPDLSPLFQGRDENYRKFMSAVIASLPQKPDSLNARLLRTVLENYLEKSEVTAADLSKLVKKFQEIVTSADPVIAEGFRKWLEIANLRWCGRLRWPVSCEEVSRPAVPLSASEISAMTKRCENFRTLGDPTDPANPTNLN